MGSPITPTDVAKMMRHISRVLDFITDDVIQTIARSLPLLTELDLKDRPEYEPDEDLSDLGIQS